MILTLTIIMLLILLSIIRSKRRGNKLVIAAIFKNENSYLEEWINFHLNQGIDHIYLYDNNDEAPNEETKQIIEKYQKKITHIIWNNVKSDKLRTVQRKAYQHCIYTYHKDFQWIALVDIDEFIYPTNNLTLKQNIIKFSNKSTPSIRIPRYNFGDSGITIRPNGGVLDNYISREQYPSSYKAISNIDYIDMTKHTFGVHRYLYTTDLNTINHNLRIKNDLTYVDKKESNQDLLNFKSEIRISMNHYYTKSKEEYIKRCKFWSSDKKINNLGSRKSCFDEDLYSKINKNEVLDLTAKKLATIFLR